MVRISVLEAVPVPIVSLLECIAGQARVGAAAGVCSFDFSFVDNRVDQAVSSQGAWPNCPCTITAIAGLDFFLFFLGLEIVVGYFLFKVWHASIRDFNSVSIDYFS